MANSGGGGGPMGGPGMGSGPGGPDPQETRNMMIFIALFFVMLLGTTFLTEPMRQQERAEVAAAAKAAAPAVVPGGAPVVQARPLEAALADTSIARVALDTPSLDGSIRLEGARFDNLNLKNYRRALPRDSGEVALLRPAEAERHYDAIFGWTAESGDTAGVGASTPWTAEPGARLTPSTPLTLTYQSPEGLVFTRVISVDNDYMFTLTDTVRNAGTAAFVLRPFSVVRREGKPDDFIPNQIVHQGFTGVFGPDNRVLQEQRYQKAEDHIRQKLEGRTGVDARLLERQSTGGWLGIGDHYWLAAVIPDQAEQINAFYDARCTQPEAANPRRCSDANENFRAAYTGGPRALGPGTEVTYTQRFFAGAKRVGVVQRYQKAFGIPDFDKAVDWGFLWFLTRPFFGLLDFFFGFVNNFGVAILLTTVVVKALLFPLAYQSYKSLAGMRKVGPRMKEIQERFAADKMRQQQEIAKLFKEENVNPVAGCLPILMQIPIFYALLKVLTVTIEMRHAPFVGWIQDLSAKDPTSWVNLFGILPFDAGIATALPVIGGLFAVGIWPILYGVSMYGVQGLNPPPPDPVQAAVFKWLPLIFTFLFAAFAAGMVIYWTWSNILTMLQQYVIMRRQGVETEFDKFLAKRFPGSGPKPAA